MPLDCFSISYEKYLMSIGVVKPSLIASISKIICLFFTDLYFVNHLKLGEYTEQTNDYDLQCLHYCFIHLCIYIYTMNMYVYMIWRIYVYLDHHI